jgi:hypothetical protein
MPTNKFSGQNIIVGGTDNSFIGNVTDRLKVDATGTFNSIPSDNIQATYSAAVSNFVPPTSATDIFTITGSATKIIKITAITATGTTPAGGGILLGLTLLKRSTNDSGGTSTTMTNVPHDSSQGAATVTIKAYTANPTLGTSVGIIRAIRMVVPAASAQGNGSGGFSVWDFGIRPSKPIYLRGANEQLCINMSATTVTGPVFSAFVEWTEI